jgi:aldehyde:ferredoxin oxidoreductase
MNAYGWNNRILRIDLSKSQIDSFVPEDTVLKNYLGGRGLGAKIVYDAGRVDALSPDNMLVFAAGPLTGTTTPASGRVSLSTKSPLTGTIFDSNCGGSFGPELKKAGYDAPDPVFIEIEDARVELLSAVPLWGKNVKATTSILKAKGSVACIGRAGENLAYLASIIADATHAFGRGGVGAVMGSKNLKAIAVKGTDSVDIFDRADYTKQKKAINRLLIASPTISKGLSVFGTPFLVKITSWMKILPVANFWLAEPDIDLKPFFATTIANEYSPRKKACYSCPIACLLNLTEMVGERAGIGERLGRGAKLFSPSEGYPEKSIQVKGLELPAYDPRGVKGLGFSYATSNRGGCHTRAYLVAPEILRKPKAIGPYTLAGKAGHTKIFQDRFAAVDSLVVCKFAFFGAGEEEYANILSAVTGENYTSEDLMLVGERIWNVERLYNVREGFGKEDDILLDRFFKEKVNGRVIDKEEFFKTLAEYYHMRGWDEKGVPTEGTLKKLGV